MAVPRVQIDEDTQARLGQAGIQEITTHLWARDCQTCGRALGSQPPSLCIFDMQIFYSASLHHQRCRAPEWNDSGFVQSTSSAGLTHETCSVLMPFQHGDASAPDLRPAMLLNPGLEHVLFERTALGTWQVVISQAFSHAGLKPVGQIPIDAPVPGAIAHHGRNEVAVTIQSPPGGTYSVGLDVAEIDSAIRTQQGVLLMVSHLFDTTNITPYSLQEVFRSGHVLAGWVALEGAHPGPAPTPESKKGRDYTVFWHDGHATVGEVVAHSGGHFSDEAARRWAEKKLSRPDTLIGWEHVNERHPADGWITLEALSAAHYVLRHHTDGWRLVHVRSRNDGGGFETVVEVRAWANEVLAFRDEVRAIDWQETEFPTDGAVVLMGRS